MKKTGKCHLCGQNKPLTFEHILPEKANNTNNAHIISGDTLKWGHSPFLNYTFGTSLKSIKINLINVKL